MSAFLVVVLRLAFLAVVWLFILLAANIIRTDIFGQRVDADGQKLRGRKTRKAAESAATPDPESPAVTRARRLLVVEGRQPGVEYALNGMLTLGRAATQDVLVDDDYSSSRHAQLSPAGDGTWVVEDLNSTNGTYVNGTRITLPTRVGVGDSIRIGRTQLRLES